MAPMKSNGWRNLRLDVKEGGAFSHDLIVPGDAAKSRLFQRVTSGKMRMPPASAGPALTDKQMEALKQWINEGAKWELHWAYRAAEASGDARGSS